MTAELGATPSRASRPGLEHSIIRAAAIEFAATAFLLVAVVGSGIMAERLSGGNMALALLANSIATGGALVALILAFGPQGRVRKDSGQRLQMLFEPPSSRLMR